MAKRSLVLDGTISRRQFWPTGRSGPEVFRVRFELPGTARSRRRRQGVDPAALVGAHIAGASERVVLHTELGSLVRLRGVSTPVLHARPDPIRPRAELTPAQRARFREREREYRQPLAETAAFAFKRMLRLFGTSTVSCRVTVPATRPADAVDAQGRLLADVTVEANGKSTSLSQWLLYEGWAFPDLTSALSKEECRTLLRHAQRARKAGLGVWATYTTHIGRFAPQRTFRRREKGSPRVDDTGVLWLPRLYRLQASHSANRYAKLTTLSLREYLEEHPTPCHVTASYLRRRRSLPPVRYLHEFIRPEGVLYKHPGELVFREPRPRLISATGELMKRW